MKLKDRVALITGAGSGMGEAIAMLFAKEGAKVVVVDMNEDNIKRVLMDIKDHNGEAIGVKCDVSKIEDVAKAYADVIENFGGVDILVNNAGIMDNFVPVADLDANEFEKVLAVNLKGPFLLAKEALREFMNKQKPGVIINIASVGGLFGARGGAAYVASKHGVIGLTKNIAATYRDYNIRCVAIAPGGINTNIGKTITKPHVIGSKALATGTGQSPMGEPIDIANAALYLASDDAEFVNGTVLTVDGGWTAA